MKPYKLSKRRKTTTATASYSVQVRSSGEEVGYLSKLPSRGWYGFLGAEILGPFEKRDAAAAAVWKFHDKPRPKRGTVAAWLRSRGI